MPLKVTSLARVHGPACNHRRIVVDDNGVTRERVLTPSEVLALFDDFPGGARGALVLAWMADRLSRGATVAQLQDIEIESVI